MTKDAIHLQVKAQIVGHMLDGKAVKLYTGLGGSDCDLCCYSKGECLDRNLVEQGFTITRNIEDLLSICNELAGVVGNIVTAKNDYPTRAGLTTKPIVTNEVVSGQVLHSLLRNFDHWTKTVVRVRAGVQDWSESKTSWNHQFIIKAKKELQDIIHKNIHGVRWDIPDPAGKGGTTTTGNTSRNELHSSINREIILVDISQQVKEPLSVYGQHVSVILRVRSSSKLSMSRKSFAPNCTSTSWTTSRGFITSICVDSGLASRQVSTSCLHILGTLF